MIDKQSELDKIEVLHAKLRGLCKAADTIAEDGYGEHSDYRQQALGQVQSLMYTASGLFEEMENALHAAKFGTVCSSDPRFVAKPEAMTAKAAGRPGKKPKGLYAQESSQAPTGTSTPESEAAAAHFYITGKEDSPEYRASSQTHPHTGP